MSPEVKRILMLCYYFPPMITSGAARSVGFALNLKQFGWEPTVLTVRESKSPWMETDKLAKVPIHTVRTHELNLAGLVDIAHGILSRCLRVFGRRLRANYFLDLLCIPDPQLAWLSIPKGIRLARQSDVVYATCSPFSSAIAGCVISWWTGRPLVLDFRDPWSMNAHDRHTKLHRRIAVVFERLVLRKCDRIILNTPDALVLYQRAYPHLAEKMLAIPNGFDALPPPPLPRADNVFTIMHVGSFYGTRTADDLLDVLAELANDQIEFVQVGPRCDVMRNYAGRVRMRSVATVNREQAMELMRSASLLYLKQGSGRGGRELVTVAAKTYEYLASGLPILADVVPGSDAKLITAYGRNAWVVTSGSKEDLKQAVLAAFAARGTMCPAVDPEFVGRYSREHLTRRLAMELDNLVEPLSAEKPVAVDQSYEYA